MYTYTHIYMYMYTYMSYMCFMTVVPRSTQYHSYEIYIYIYIYMCTHIRVSIYIYIHIYIYIYMCIYIYAYIHVYICAFMYAYLISHYIIRRPLLQRTLEAPETTLPTHSHGVRANWPSGSASVGLRCPLGNFTSLDFEMFLRCFCADSSSPQISAILVGHFAMENASLRKSPQLPAKLPKDLRRKKKSPGSRHSYVSQGKASPSSV